LLPDQQHNNFNNQNPKTMNRILVILTIDTDNLPSNFPEILKHEREVVAQ
jgi:hypothetical protein